MTYKLIKSDNGNCRVYYRKTANRSIFCFQEEKPNTFQFYLCSQDGEPECEAKFSGQIDKLPQDVSQTSKNFVRWFEKNWAANRFVDKDLKWLKGVR